MRETRWIHHKYSRASRRWQGWNRSPGSLAPCSNSCAYLPSRSLPYLPSSHCGLPLLPPNNSSQGDQGLVCKHGTGQPLAPLATMNDSADWPSIPAVCVCLHSCGCPALLGLLTTTPELSSDPSPPLLSSTVLRHCSVRAPSACPPRPQPQAGDAKNDHGLNQPLTGNVPASVPLALTSVRAFFLWSHLHKI